MKKIFLWTLILCMVAILPLQASAAAVAQVQPAAAGVKPGEQITFTVIISGAEDVGSMAVLPLYSKDCFTMVEGKWLIGGVLSDFDTEKDLGVIALVPGTQVNTQVFTFTLQAKENAPLGEQEIGSTVAMIDSASNRTELDAKATKITVTENPETLPEVPTYIPQEPKAFPWIWVGVGAACVIAAVAVILVLREKKKKV